MADAVLHIKDGYFFEVPKALWPQHYTDLSQVPEFLVKAHPHESLATFNDQLSGKILIPQPFATLTDLYTKESGFGITKFMVLELLAAVIIAVVFIRISRKIETGEAPKGRWWNLCEVFLVFIRDQIARPAIGGHDADRFVPLLWTMFFFILTCNLLGMVPWMGAPTSAIGVTMSLALVIFATTLTAGMLRFGPIGFWINQVPHMELPMWLSPLKLMIFAIEVVGLVIKHVVLGVRLLANMVAGHLVLLGIMGLIVAAAAATPSTFAIVSVITVLGSTAFSLLELFVAFLQAYIFTFLSALFIGAAIHHH